MKWTDKIEKRGPARPFYTFEFFPPRTDQVSTRLTPLRNCFDDRSKGFANLLPRISRLNSLGPLGISVTWGAGGSTQDRSLDLAGLTQSEYGIDTLLHLTCTNIVQERLDDALKVLLGGFEGGKPIADPRSTSVGSEIPRDSKYLGLEGRYDDKAANLYP